VPSTHPEFWTFVVANVFVLAIGIVLTVLCVQADRQSGNRPFRYATVGFLLITLSGVGDASYELGIRAGYDLSARQLLLLHTAESVLIGLGLAALFYSIKHY
jgi:predicted cobalt transporter CbtA